MRKTAQAFTDHPAWTSGMRLMGPSGPLQPQHLDMTLNNTDVAASVDRLLHHDNRGIENPKGTHKPEEDSLCKYGVCWADPLFLKCKTATHNVHHKLKSLKLTRDKFPVMMQIGSLAYTETVFIAENYYDSLQLYMRLELEVQGGVTLAFPMTVLRPSGKRSTVYETSYTHFMRVLKEIGRHERRSPAEVAYLQMKLFDYYDCGMRARSALRPPSSSRLRPPSRWTLRSVSRSTHHRKRRRPSRSQTWTTTIWTTRTTTFGASKSRATDLPARPIANPRRKSRMMNRQHHRRLCRRRRANGARYLQGVQVWARR